MAEPSDYLILGAGVFGASTALHLIRASPRARITLVDRNAAAAPIRVAASWDWNKVVRADYADIEYMRLALEAKQLWASDPLWAPFYHESGASWVSPSDFSQVVRENYKILGVESGLEALSVEQARKEFGGVFEGGDFTGASNGSVPHSGDKTLKFWGQIIFRNTQPHANGSQISRPPSGPDYAQLNVPKSLRDDVDFAGKSIYGKLSDDWTVENYRICCEDFIISPHSGSKNLFVATIGSFHGWKFLPVLGKYVVQMLQGTLEDKLAKKWAWDKTLVPPTHSAWPRKELSELK
ncbi:L-pipecolate oxidase [Colletotrichum sp. SAR 10_70]|nr:L-pipecolate oxidase [Colletotrichum sp. SAR 10_71]KAI8192803.1 L-pipecolate oxidase [Colletotrichum sp. SAR 10_70]